MVPILNMLQASEKSLYSKFPQMADSKMAVPADWRLAIGHPLPAEWRYFPQNAGFFSQNGRGFFPEKLNFL